MLGGIVAVIIYVLSNPNVGGLSEGLKKLGTVDPKLSEVVGPPGIINLLSFVVLTSLGSWGLPQMVHKFYAIRDDRAIRRGTVISTVFAVIFAGGAYFLGSFGRLFFSDFTSLAVPMNDAGKVIYDRIMPIVFSTALPQILLGLVLVLVLSASMSTLSSLVLVSSSAISMDLVGGVLAPKMDKKKVNILMRVFCAVFVICSFLIAWGSSQSNSGVMSVIVKLMSLSWGTLAGAFLGPFLSGLWMKRAGKLSAWAGMLTGFAAAMVFNFIPMTIAGLKITPLIAGSIAMFTSIIVSFAVARFAPSKKVFDTAMKAPDTHGSAAA
jgi:SSS family solute:Na+ symporter/sodium/proline symporter